MLLCTAAADMSTPEPAETKTDIKEIRKCLPARRDRRPRRASSLPHLADQSISYCLRASQHRREACDDQCSTTGTSAQAINNRRYTRLLQHCSQPLLAGAKRLRAILRRQRLCRNTWWPYHSATCREHYVTESLARHHTWLAVVARWSSKPCYAQRPYSPDRLL